MTTYQYKLSDLSYLTEDIVLLHFMPKENSPILSYVSGQYIDVLTKNNANFPLSIANAPAQDNKSNIITVHLRAGSHHPLAETFLNEIKEQGFIIFTGPVGHCIVKPADTYYFIAGGTGFSPIQALLTDLLPLGKPCLLYWGISHTKDLYQQKLIQTWLTKYPNLSYIPVLLKADNAWLGETGWVHEVFFEEQTKMLIQHSAQNKIYYVYASGPYPLIQALKAGFITHHLPLDHLLSDMLPIK